MADTDAMRRAECERYSEIADATRALIPHVAQSEAAEDLRLLVVRYEKLADYLETAPYPPQDIEEVPT